MTLSVEVGFLADLRENDQASYEERFQQFAAVNQALQAAGLSLHHEPTDLNGRQPWWCAIGAHANLHTLRNLAAYLWINQQLPEPDLAEDAFERAMSTCWKRDADPRSQFAAPHLLFHYDDSGFYLPIAFEQVLRPVHSLFEMTGGWIGSSQMLLQECRAVGTALEVPLDDALIWEGQAEWWDAPESPPGCPALWEHYPEEARVCWLLHNACLVSIRTNCAICFLG